MVATFRQPFDSLAETNAAVARSKAGNGGNSSKNEIWLCMQSAANLSLRISLLNRENTGNFHENGRIRADDRW